MFLGHFATACAASNVTSPPPPSSEAVVWVGAIGGPVLVALAAWVDRRREPA